MTTPSNGARSMLVRHVTVDRTRSPEEMINATGRKEYASREALATMPGKGEVTEEAVDLYLFTLGRYLTNDEQERELEAHGLVPDPYAQIQVNIDDPHFADDHPNGAQWRDNEGRACYIVFYRASDYQRNVYVNCGAYGWHGYWWCGGRRSAK